MITLQIFCVNNNISRILWQVTKRWQAATYMRGTIPFSATHYLRAMPARTITISTNNPVLPTTHFERNKSAIHMCTPL
jgi:hypothetical protein